MDWKDVAAKVSSAAPVLGGILGGPVGGAVGTVISLIASAFGINKQDVTPEKLDSLLTTDPATTIKLKEIEATYQVELAKLLLESERMNLSDRADARAREVKISQATGTRDINLYVLAWMVVALFFTLVGTLMWVKLPESNIGPINQLFGAMAAGFGMVLQYFFGSSKSSTDKTALMAQAGK